MTENLCEDGLEHEIVDCPNCGYLFCSDCGKGENDTLQAKSEPHKEDCGCFDCSEDINVKNVREQAKSEPKEKTCHDYSTEEWYKLSEEEQDKVKPCRDYNCFECHGDHLSY